MSPPPPLPRSRSGLMTTSARGLAEPLLPLGTSEHVELRKESRSPTYVHSCKSSACAMRSIPFGDMPSEGGIRSAFMVFDSDGSNGVTLREPRPKSTSQSRLRETQGCVFMD